MSDRKEVVARAKEMREYLFGKRKELKSKISNEK